MIHGKFLILFLALTVVASGLTVTVCSEPTPSSGNLYAIVEPSAGDPEIIDYSLYTSVFLISSDGAAMWDKTCGYPYHYSCATSESPSVMLTTMPGATGLGFALTPSVGDPGAVITINNWASHPLDEVNGRWVQVFVIPIAVLNENPWVLFAHGEGAQIETAVTDLYAHSAILDRNGPQDARCAAFFPPPQTAIEVPIPPVPSTIPLTDNIPLTGSDSNTPSPTPIYITVTSTVTVTATVTFSPPPSNAILNGNGQTSGASRHGPGPILAIAAASAIYFLFAY